MAKKKRDTNSLARSVVIPLNAETPEALAATRAGIVQYRLGLRKLYSLLALAEMAGADVEENDNGDLRLMPNGERATMILTAALAEDREITSVKNVRGQGVTMAMRVGAAPAYGLRDWFTRQYWPTARGTTWDSSRIDVWNTWKSRDPQLNATRGYLAMQGARRMALFSKRGIGFPKVGSPVFRLGDHTVSAVWDNTVGWLNYTFGTLHPRQYGIVRNLLNPDSGYSMGTAYLSMDDKRDLRTVVTYSMPASMKDLDPDRVCYLSLDTMPARFEEWCWVIHRQGETPDHEDLMGFANLGGLLVRLAVQQDKLKQRIRNCGHPSRPWGHRKGWLATQDVISRATKQREGIVTDFNHVWTRRFVDRAVSWRCGTLELRGDCYQETIGPYPWNWYQFKSMLKYKCDEVGIKLILPPTDKSKPRARRKAAASG